jgi:hypothetical protein
MKKLVLIIACALGTFSFAKANNYTIDEQKLAQTFEQSVEVTFDEMYASDLSALTANYSKASGEKTWGGYLVRSYFCGIIALHRYYMGTNKKAMWAMYFCIPLMGQINATVDFCWVLFSKEAMSKYADNDKYIVWLD